MENCSDFCEQNLTVRVRWKIRSEVGCLSQQSTILSMLEKVWNNRARIPSKFTDWILYLQKKAKIVSLHWLKSAFLGNLLQLNWCASSASKHGNTC